MNFDSIKSSCLTMSFTQHLTDQMKLLCMSDKYADIEFIVEGLRIPSHRLILATRSEYFRALLFGGMSETNQREVSLSVPLLPFKALLIYLYTGQLLVSLDDSDSNDSASLLDILGLADEYLLHDLISAISKELCAHLSVANIFVILKAAKTYNLPELLEACLKFIDRRPYEVLRHDSIKYLSMDSVIEIIKRDTFCMAEIEIFRMVTRWKQYNIDVDDINPILSNVRFHLINDYDLVTVKDSNLLDSKMLLKLATDKALSETLPRRTRFWENEVLSVECASGSRTGNCPKFTLTDYTMINYIEVTLEESCAVSIQVFDGQKEICIGEGSCNPFARFNFTALRVLIIRVTSTTSCKKLTVLELKPMYIIPKC